MSSNSDRARRLAVPPGEDPANAEAWRNRCHDCGREGHRAFSAECGLEILRREHIQQTIQLEQMERERIADGLAEDQPSEAIMQLDERIRELAHDTEILQRKKEALERDYLQLKSRLENKDKEVEALKQQLERAKKGQE